MTSEQIKKYRGIIMYLIFGVLTTAINIVVYHICYNICLMENTPAVFVAWLAAVVFAFVTNKRFVFESKCYKKQVVLRELRDFFICRIATGLLDVAIMFIAVDLLKKNALLWKAGANILVIILNYIASKLVIFKNKSDIPKSRL